LFGAVLNSSFTRIVPISMILLAVQKTLLIEMRPFGVIIQILLAFAASAGAAGGPERGAITGFIVGVMYDLSVGTPLGSSSITMGLAGYVAGWCDVIRIETTWWMAAGFVAVGAAVGEAGVPVVRRFIGEEDAFVPEMARIVPIVAITAALASVVLVPVSRWALKLAKPEWKLAVDE
jgi:cell shape-determining protein MreD